MILHNNLNNFFFDFPFITSLKNKGKTDHIMKPIAILIINDLILK